MLFSGTLWLLPMGLGVMIVAWGLFLSLLARRRNWTRKQRLLYLRIGRSIIPALPLSGIFGTVWGLMDTLLFMRGKTGSDFDMSGVVDRFGVALNTTLGGVVFAVIALVLYEVQIGQLEAADDAAED
jgi:biopolymer transport protein ExbB/TolQ